jgi:hypothetical protein
LGGGWNSWPAFQLLPIWSYAARFSGSFSTSLASLISLKRASASAILLTSGWYLRASLRYACLMSSCVALRGKPSVS